MTRLSLAAQARVGNIGSDGERWLETRIRQMGLPEPVREYLFALPRRWRADFAWEQPQYRLIVEVEGAVWVQGRHTRGAGAVADMEKYNAAAKAGWTVLRFTTEQVLDDTAINELVAWFQERTKA